MQVLANGRIYTICPGEDGKCIVLDPGWVAIEGSKIIGIGGGEPPENGRTAVDLKGSVVTPGLIDAHTHLGLFEEGYAKEGDDTNETSNPVTPHLRAIDGVNPRDTGFTSARENGITCVCCLPGSTNVIGGEGVVVKTAGTVVDKMVVRGRTGLKVAFGENPKRIYGERKETPTSRMAIAGLLRQSLAEAREWRADAANEKKRDLLKESLLLVLDGKIPLRVHAHRADDIMTGIRIAEEFGVSIILEHCTEGHYVAEEIAPREIPVIFGPMLLGRVKQELGEMTDKTPAVLAEAGVKIALTVDHPELSIKYLPLCAAVAAREGLADEEALKTITINPAEILGLADRVGSLEVGKDADLVVWENHPLDVRGRARMVFIEGSVVFDAGKAGSGSR